MNSNELLREKIEELPIVSKKHMFGYDCYCVQDKFFVGFRNKNKNKVIIRLSQEEQKLALKEAYIVPFSHGAKSGWVELDLSKLTGDENIYRWVKLAYKYVLKFKLRRKS